MPPGLEPLPGDEVETLLQHVMEQYGFDFRNYAPASLRRRISLIVTSEHVESVPALQEKVLADPIAFQRFVHGISVNVTSMFRDPSFYSAFRREVVPILATYPFIRVWHAGCSTGEEAYSTAIVLLEEGLYDRVRIYATDVDALSVERAKQGIYPLSAMKDYSSNYLNSGGKSSLSEYYIADHNNALFRGHLRNNIVFAQHNLACDSSFNEFHIVLCRNVLIYFNGLLAERVLSLLHDSLVIFGILALGSKESLQFTQIRSCYQEISEAERIYKKVI